MLLDYIGLLYEPFLILTHELRLILMILSERHSFLYQTNYYTSLTHLLIFILSGKNGKSLCKSCNFLGYLTSISRTYPLSLFTS